MYLPLQRDDPAYLASRRYGDVGGTLHEALRPSGEGKQTSVDGHVTSQAPQLWGSVTPMQPELPELSGRGQKLVPGGQLT